MSVPINSPILSNEYDGMRNRLSGYISDGYGYMTDPVFDHQPGRPHENRMTPGNPCVEGTGLRGMKVRPLAIEHVKGEPLFGDGGHRKWRFG